MSRPAAFTKAGRAAIRARVAPDRRIEIGSEDGCRLPGAPPRLGGGGGRGGGGGGAGGGRGGGLRAVLAERGYRVVTTPLPSFLRSGGSAFCLTLRLDRRSAAVSALPD